MGIDWVWHSGAPHYGLHADGPRKGWVAAHVTRPGGTHWRAVIPTGVGPWVDLAVVDTFEEMEATVLAWHEAHPPAAPPPKPEPRKDWRLARNLPEPARWPRGAQRR